MRIISKFRDYYDGLQEFDGSVFVRGESLKNLSDRDRNFLNDLFDKMPFKRYEMRYHYNKVLVFFCGKVYPIYYIVQYENTDINFGKVMKVYCTQSPVAFEDILSGKFNYTPSPSRYYSFFGREYPFNEKGIMNYNNLLNSNHNVIMEMFYKTKCPVFVVHKDNIPYKLEITDIKPLKEFGFQSIITPFDAYQGIKHFISNDLVYDPLRDFKMSDDLKRDSKGFDKNSFRRGKEK